MATGKITLARLSIMMQTVAKQFKIELDAMQKTKDRPMGFTKKQIGDLASGHSDGMRNMVVALRAAGIIEVEE